jgi:phytoene dehydrogenase-like protein
MQNTPQVPQVIVVGAGIAGLSAGIYARKSGFDVTILEAYSGPGGNCTGWRRGGYFFEGSMHWLNGSDPGSSLNHLWRQTGALNETSRIIIKDPFLTSDYGGQQACLYRDLDKFEKHLCGLSAEDIPLIRRMCADLRRFTAVDIPVTDLFGLKVKERAPSLIKAGIKMLPAALRMGELGKISAREYANRFHSPAIRLLLLGIVNPDYDAVSLFFTAGQFLSGDGGYAEGGTVKLVRNMEKQFTDLGGLIRYSTRVTRVLVEGGRASAVLCDKSGGEGDKTTGETLSANAVIVTTDTLAAAADPDAGGLFSPALSEPWLNKLQKNPQLVMNTFLCLGVEADLSSLPSNIIFPLEKPFEFNGKTLDYLACRNYASFPGYAPEGCSALTVIISNDCYDYWNLMRQQGSYEQSKQELFATVLEKLEARIPAMKGKTVIRDIATPLTYEKYCGTYRGSWMTKTPPGNHRRFPYPCTVKSIKNLYFAGQRILPPGGLPVGIITGRKAAQYLCRDFGRVF